MARMTTDARHRPTTEVIVPDAVFDADGRRHTTRRPADRNSVPQTRWLDRAILVLATITTVLVAGVIAVGAAIVLLLLIATGVVIGAVRSIASRARR